MIHNKVFLGKVRQYRLFRAHVNFGTDSLLYPYDTQRPSLKFQSLDYGDDTIHISTKTLNNLNGFDPKLLTVEGLESLSNIQGRSDDYNMLYLIGYMIYDSADCEIDKSMKTTFQILNGIGRVIHTTLKQSPLLSETISNFRSLLSLLKCKEMTHFSR